MKKKVAVGGYAEFGHFNLLVYIVGSDFHNSPDSVYFCFFVFYLFVFFVCFCLFVCLFVFKKAGQLLKSSEICFFLFSLFFSFWGGGGGGGREGGCVLHSV